RVVRDRVHAGPAEVRAARDDPRALDACAGVAADVDRRGARVVVHSGADQALDLDLGPASGERDDRTPGGPGRVGARLDDRGVGPRRHVRPELRPHVVHRLALLVGEEGVDLLLAREGVLAPDVQHRPARGARLRAEVDAVLVHVPLDVGGRGALSDSQAAPGELGDPERPVGELVDAVLEPGAPFPRADPDALLVRHVLRRDDRRRLLLLGHRRQVGQGAIARQTRDPAATAAASTAATAPAAVDGARAVLL